MAGLILPIVEYRAIPQSKDYFAATDGRIYRRLSNGVQRPLNATIAKSGYRVACVTLNGKRVLSHVHELVLLAFEGPRPVGAVTRHLDGNQLNNRPSNLKWGTRSENYQDMVDHGVAPRGERHGMAKLTVEKVRRIKDLLREGMFPKDIAYRMGVSVGCIRDIKNKYCWRFVE